MRQHAVGRDAGPWRSFRFRLRGQVVMQSSEHGDRALTEGIELTHVHKGRVDVGDFGVDGDRRRFALRMQEDSASAATWWAASVDSSGGRVTGSANASPWARRFVLAVATLVAAESDKAMECAGAEPWAGVLVRARGRCDADAATFRRRLLTLTVPQDCRGIVEPGGTVGEVVGLFERGPRRLYAGEGDESLTLSVPGLQLQLTRRVHYSIERSEADPTIGHEPTEALDRIEEPGLLAGIDPVGVADWIARHADAAPFGCPRLGAAALWLEAVLGEAPSCSVGPLVDRLTDGRYGLRAADVVLGALARVGTDEMQTAILRVARAAEGAEVRAAGWRSLFGVVAPSVELLEAVAARVRQPQITSRSRITAFGLLADLIAKCQDDELVVNMVARLREVGDGPLESAERSLWLHSLGRTGHPDAVEPIRRALAMPDAQGRLAALAAMTHLPPESVRDDLERALTDDIDPDVRRQALSSWLSVAGGHEDPERRRMVRVLAGVAQRDLDPEVRRVALLALGEAVGLPAARAALQAAADEETSPALRAMVRKLLDESEQ